MAASARSAFRSTTSRCGRASPTPRSIHLLPALPKAWAASGSVKGLRARGGYELDFSWKDGSIASLTVHDLRPATAAASKLTLNDGRRTWKIKTKPGQVKKIM